MTYPLPSPAAMAFTWAQEVNAPYNPRPNWPGAQSGVTIGGGYDLGQQSALRIGLDWKALPDAIVSRLMAMAGIQGAAAQALIASCQDIAIPEDVAREVFDSINIPRAANQTALAFPNCDLLSGDSFGALVDIVYNRGPGMGSPSDPPPDRRREMREIRDAMQAQEFDAIPDIILTMPRVWIGDSIAHDMAQRCHGRAQLFYQGLTPDLQAKVDARRAAATSQGALT